jgi:hypothetical protein
MKKPTRYDFSKPIRIIQYKSPRFDIIFYSLIYSALVLIIFALLFIHDGKFKIDFVLWRVLVAFPLVLIAYLFQQLLDELRIYPKKLMSKHSWKIEELMELTGKDQKETENIMSHVFESCFVVDDKNILKEE